MAQGKKVLLIDDDEDFRDALVEQLSIIEGFEVFEAGDAAETLAIIKNTEFDNHSKRPFKRNNTGFLRDTWNNEACNVSG